MNSDVEAHIRKNCSWAKLPPTVKQQLGNSLKEYEKCVVTFSVKNQLRYRGNIIRHIKKDEKKYYEDLIEYSRKSLLLFPYHLSDVIIKGLKITPFMYYIAMLEYIISQEKSYDSLPNFTAADCLRLLGIGRNQYIELMNQTRSSRKFGFFRKSGRELLPTKPISSVPILPWWTVQVGFITEDDMKAADKDEHIMIDQLIDEGPTQAGTLNYDTVHQLYIKGYTYLDVPISDDDYVIVPPLEGFVMNRVCGDYFETLLYKIFVSIDENTTVAELASVLEIDVSHVKDAVSLYCRLGFARKKNAELDSNDLHPSWYEHLDSASTPVVKVGRARSMSIGSEDEDDSLLRELNQALETDEEFVKPNKDEIDAAVVATGRQSVLSANHTETSKKIAFMFDSTLTAYLMMGNLSPGLKNHAVTMFEVGKLSDESLDSLVAELEKVSDGEGEGEAARYFSHALTLRETILFFRQNAKLGDETDNMCLGLDLIRCESLQSLDHSTASRLLNKNYSLLVSMAPLSNEIRPISSCFPPHLGPAIPEVSSVWFKMFLYHVTGYGPPSVLLAKGTRLRRLPRIFDRCNRLLVTTWGHDPSEIPVPGALTMLLDALQHSSVLVQAYSMTNEQETETKFVPYPPLDPGDPKSKEYAKWYDHPSLLKLKDTVDLEHCCGFVTLLNFKLKKSPAKPSLDLALPAPTHSPKTVDMDKASVDLLEEELDNIDNPLAGQAGSTEDLRNRVGLSLDVVTSQNEDNWTFLDLNFGIPLFDAELNNKICERIISNGLWKNKSLEALVHSSRKLCLELLDFIGEHQDLPVLAENGADIAFPTRNLIFLDGKLDYWDGR